jgi:sporulation protein YlmC with PRC-barrel domain
MRQANRSNAQGTRFHRVLARDSVATALLQGCPVVTADGAEIGHVESLLIERKTRQLRYVMLKRKAHTAEHGCDASIVIPWQALYFDSATACLVFYTYS